ncbi:MAG: tetratricopeptide repeat protein [Chloroflexi bacterium]|nr:MAG: tetratricopeptide repeat protein [Chloroflexota bacterium]
MRIAEELEHTPSFTGMCLGFGILHMRRDDLDRAIPVLERGLAVGRRWSIFLYVFTIVSAVGRAYALKGRLAEGLPLLTEAVQEAESKNAALGHAVRVAWLAEGYLAAGEYERAWDRGREALDLSHRNKETGQEAWTLHLLGEIVAHRDPADVESAERFYCQAMTLAEPRGMRPLVAHCHLGLGKLYRRTGKREQAQEHLATAMTMYAKMDMRFWLEKAEAELQALS